MVGGSCNAVCSPHAGNLTVQRHDLAATMEFMKGIFALSYVLLCGLVAFEAVVLQEVVRRAAWFKRFCSDFGQRTEPPGLPTGTRAPEFSVPVLGGVEPLATCALEGHESILVFVSPKDASSTSYEALPTVIHALWHKLEGHIHLVCGGGEKSCSQLARKLGLRGYGATQLRMVLDEEGSIAQSFRIKTTPEAVELDQHVRVKRYGRSEISNMEIEAERNHSPAGA